MRIAIASYKETLPPSDELLRQALGAEAAVWWDAAVDWRAFDAVVVRSCWDYHLRLPEFLLWIEGLEQAGVRLINAPELIRWNCSKTYLREFAARGVQIAATVWVGDGESVDLERVCDEHGWLEAVVKPLVSASAYGTGRRRTGVVRGPAMVQEFLSGIETEGEWSLFYFGGVFSHAVRKRPASGDFRVQMEYGGTAETGVPAGGVLEFAERALGLLPVPAVLARVDVIADDGACVLMEMEVIEPELFLDLAPGAVERAAKAVLTAIVQR